MSDIAGGRRRRADAQANHTALLTAAARLFAERGAEVTYEEIAQRAGVGRATLYRHFPTREDLLAAILDGILDKLKDTAEKLPAGPERFFSLFHTCVELQERTLALIDFVTDSTPAPTLERLRGRFEDLFSPSLEEARRAGILREDLTAGDVRIVLLMISAVNRPRPLGLDRRRASELAEAMLRRGR